LLVIGGGITGAGVSLDATLRGLRVALIDKGDFAYGTSSISSKLVHGGLRKQVLGQRPISEPETAVRVMILVRYGQALSTQSVGVGKDAYSLSRVVAFVSRGKPTAR
jgi:glycine/D-amino acid oxidase-like deaminating enzyme